MANRRPNEDETLQELQNINEDESDGGELDSDDEYVPPQDQDSSSDENGDDDNSPGEEDAAQPSSSRGQPSSRRGRGRGCGRGRSRGKGGSRQDTQTSGTASIGSKEVATDGTEWETIAPGLNSAGRRALHNILRENPGPTNYAKRHITEESVSSAWMLMINDKILRHISDCTEKEAHRQLNNDTWSLSQHELEAFIAVLYARGAFGANTLPILSLWNSKWGPRFFPETIARDRFLEIMRFLRLDAKSTRSERLKTDKFALASEVWNTFTENCILCYKPGPNITVDEQLFPSKARCRFTQYMSNKPDKFGLKFWMLADVNSKYVLNAFPYLGKDEQRPQDQNLGEYVVLRLAEPFLGAGRNITTDNFFTSLALARKLKAKKTSLVGTLNRIRKEIPRSVKHTKDALHSSRLFKSGDTTLTSYQGKVHKNVLLLSTLHSSVEVASDGKKLPETVHFYNSTKYGVDVVDQMARKYTVKSASRRWPIHVLFNILDLAAINAWILYKEVTGERIKRRDFILRLCEELRENYAGRAPAVQQPQAAVSATPSRAGTTNPRKRRQCQVGLCKGNKSADLCNQCTKVVCGSCTAEFTRVCKVCKS